MYMWANQGGGIQPVSCWERFLPLAGFLLCV